MNFTKTRQHPENDIFELPRVPECYAHVTGSDSVTWRYFRFLKIQYETIQKRGKRFISRSSRVLVSGLLNSTVLL